jgi:hypothetical protein
MTQNDSVRQKAVQVTKEKKNMRQLPIHEDIAY